MDILDDKLVGACIFGQSGGPTAVINASAYGVIRTALQSEDITEVYAAANGIVGVLEDKLYDMGQEDPYELSLLLNTPSSELGSMDTCNKVSRYMESVGYDCRVMGVPKTIDNDLYGTDHCPGFGSAARYIATSCMEIKKDTNVYDTPMITVVETMGRHAGWLAGSAALATDAGCGPDLIYLPEVDFDMEAFYADVEKILKEKGKVLAVVSEGIHYADGRFVSEAKTSATDGFGHAQLGGLAALLANLLKERFGVKVRGIELSLLQRCASHQASEMDIQEAFHVGKMAVLESTIGQTGQMVALNRKFDEEGKYVLSTTLFPLSKVANYENKVPLEWINEEKNFVTQEFIDYAKPLIQGDPKIVYEGSLPRFARLKKILAD